MAQLFSHNSKSLTPLLKYSVNFHKSKIVKLVMVPLPLLFWPLNFSDVLMSLSRTRFMLPQLWRVIVSLLKNPSNILQEPSQSRLTLSEEMPSSTQQRPPCLPSCLDLNLISSPKWLSPLWKESRLLTSREKLNTLLRPSTL